LIVAGLFGSQLLERLWRGHACQWDFGGISLGLVFEERDEVFQLFLQLGGSGFSFGAFPAARDGWLAVFLETVAPVEEVRMFSNYRAT